MDTPDGIYDLMQFLFELNVIFLYYYRLEAIGEITAVKSGKIQKKVPIPGLSSEVKYPWPKINVGDSASFEPVKNEALDQFIRKVITSWRYYGYKMDKKFNTLLMRKESSVRVWRIRVKKGEKRNKF